MKIANLVGHSIQLREVVLEKIICSKQSELPSGEKVEIVIDISTSSKIIDSSTAHVFLKLVLNTKNLSLFKIEIVLKGVLITAKECTKTALKQFSDTQALGLLFPWAREFVSNVTSRMGFPNLMLPTISIIDTLRSNQSLNEDKKIEQSE